MKITEPAEWGEWVCVPQPMGQSYFLSLKLPGFTNKPITPMWPWTQHHYSHSILQQQILPHGQTHIHGDTEPVTRTSTITTTNTFWGTAIILPSTNEQQELEWVCFMNPSSIICHSSVLLSFPQSSWISVHCQIFLESEEWVSRHPPITVTKHFYLISYNTAASLLIHCFLVLLLNIMVFGPLFL